MQNRRKPEIISFAGQCTAVGQRAQLRRHAVNPSMGAPLRHPWRNGHGKADTLCPPEDTRRWLSAYRQRRCCPKQQWGLPKPTGKCHGRKLLLHFRHFRHPWRSDAFAERPWGELARRDKVKMPDRTLSMFAAGIFSEWHLPKRVVKCNRAAASLCSGPDRRYAFPRGAWEQETGFRLSRLTAAGSG
ncbi:hypothetical protein OJHNALOF_00784 [Oceanimonas sp. MB9]|nr:hypothetical protein [Oceanimonas sp. MB9]